MNRNRRGESRNRKLYKNPDSAKFCGVCSGLAEYFDLETWVVRLIAVSFLLFSGGTAVIAYFVGCFILDAKPGSLNSNSCFENKIKRKIKRDFDGEESENRQYTASVKEVWKKGKAPTETLHNVESSFDKMEVKLQKLESYVTSNQYQLAKEFENM